MHGIRLGITLPLLQAVERNGMTICQWLDKGARDGDRGLLLYLSVSGGGASGVKGALRVAGGPLPGGRGGGGRRRMHPPCTSWGPTTRPARRSWLWC
jgi:hypothetical protein